MIGGVSTLAMREATQSALQRTQSRLAEATAELSSGRYQDPGLRLGIAVGKVLDLHQIGGQIDTISDINNLARMRLDATQGALSSIADLGQGLIAQAIAFRGGNVDRQILVEDARARLEQLTGLLGTTSNGVHVFSGDRTNVAPLATYETNPPGTGQTAVKLAFVSQFGFPPDDPQVSDITPAQFAAYLEGDHAANFTNLAWQQNFSLASDALLQDRISLNETIETPVTANSDGIRKLVQALTAVIDGGATNLNADSFGTLMDHVARLSGDAGADIARSQSIVGLNLERINKAGERLTMQVSLVGKTLGRLEDVDAIEATARVNLLSTKLEISYAATARLQSLSVLDYL